MKVAHIIKCLLVGGCGEYLFDLTKYKLYVRKLGSINNPQKTEILLLFTYSSRIKSTIQVLSSPENKESKNIRLCKNFTLKSFFTLYVF